MADVTERVAAGAAWLDENDPDWWRPDVDRAIDLAMLDLAHSGRCVLGQRCPVETLADFLGAEPDDDEGERYYAYLSSLGVDEGWAVARGFCEAAPAAVTAAGRGRWRLLTDEWKRVISERRAGAS